MKFTLICVMLCSLSLANANDLSETRKKLFESNATCDQAIFSNDHYLVTSIGNTIHVQSLNDTSTFDLFAKNQIVDLKIEGDSLFVLTQTTIESWNLKSKTPQFVYPSHPQINSEGSIREKASGFIIKNGFAIISHGTLGISLVDIQSGKSEGIVPMPTISAAQDIALLDNETAVIAVDNNDAGTFRGLYLLNLKSFEITKQIPIDNAYSSSIRVLSNNRLMLGFYNAIWKFDTNLSISSKKEPKPNRRTWKFPGVYKVDMVGKVFYDEKFLYGCFIVSDENKPMVFDLNLLKLK